MKLNIEEIRQKYMDNPPEGMTSKDIRLMSAYSARTAHPFRRNGAPFRFKLSKAQQVD